MKNKKKQHLPLVKTLDPEALKKLVYESGIPIPQLERGIGMPKNTLSNCLLENNTTTNKMGAKYVRTLPAKWEQPLINFIKQKKSDKEELKIEVKEVLAAHNIEVKEPEISIPDKERKEAWIQKMLEVKAELN